MGMVANAYYTAAMVRALPDDGKRYETVHGELLVTPSPGMWHQVLLSRLFTTLMPYIERHGIGQLLWSPADISWDEDILVQPDLFVLDAEEAKFLDWKKAKTLLLVIEILSPSTARNDRVVKRRLYQEQRIPAYWIVDPEANAIEIWTPDATEATRRTDTVVWEPQGVGSALTIDLKGLFEPI